MSDIGVDMDLDVDSSRIDDGSGAAPHDLVPNTPGSSKNSMTPNIGPTT